MKVKVYSWGGRFLGELEWREGEVVVKGEERLRRLVRRVEERGVRERGGLRRGGRIVEVVREKKERDELYFRLLVEELIKRGVVVRREER